MQITAWENNRNDEEINANFIQIPTTIKKKKIFKTKRI